MPSTDSTRFLVQMAMNVFISNYANKKLAKINTRKQARHSLKSYLTFLLISVLIIVLNQAVYFFFKPTNLYEQLNVPRNLPLSEFKALEQDLKVRLYSVPNMPEVEKIKAIKKVENIIKVLAHPARRLTYDTFGETDTGYAWSFTSTAFLLSSLISASIFYIISTFINMISDKKGEIKEVFKLEIIVMIMLFLWEVELIMKTENRLHSSTDVLDNVYTAFPIFERREMIKIILIPCMNIIKFFYRFYIVSESQKKFIAIAKQPQLRELTAKVSEAANKLEIDQHLEEKVQKTIAQLSRQYPLNSEIYNSQRKILQMLVANEGQNILLDDEIAILARYFLLK